MSDELSGQAPVAADVSRERIVLLIRLSIVVDVVVAALELVAGGRETPLLYAKSALATSQLGLLGVWLGFSEPWPSARQIVACGAAVVAWFIAFAGLELVAWRSIYGLAIPAAMPATVAVGLFIVRSADVRLYNIRSDQAAVFGAGPAPYQFSLRQMFVWTAIVAALATAVSMLVAWMGGRIAIGIAVLIVSCLTWAAVWAVLGRSVGWRIGVLCLAPGMLIFALSLLIGPPGTVPWSLAIALLLHCLLTAGSLAVFRACGYRVGRMRAEG